nr:26S proteasome non-ATPase regulatory subunit 2 homolog A-like [Ipomoea batatas]
MTSVPKPVKFLRPHYGTLKSHYEKMSDSGAKKLMADILSVIALPNSAGGERESLKYRLLGSYGDIGSWGHEYVTNLGVEAAQECLESYQTEDLIELVRQTVAFHMKHNAEHEAVMLLMELYPVEELSIQLESSLDSANYERTCSYLVSSAK